MAPYDPNPVSHVYALVDPSDRRARYVGRSEEPAKRLKSHVHQSLAAVRSRRDHDARGEPGQGHHPTQKDLWVSGLAEAGEAPLLAILETTDRAGAKAAEGRWVAKLEAEGHPLLNAEVLRRHRSNGSIMQEAFDLGRELFGTDT